MDKKAKRDKDGKLLESCTNILVKISRQWHPYRLVESDKKHESWGYILENFRKMENEWESQWCEWMDSSWILKWSIKEDDETFKMDRKWIHEWNVNKNNDNARFVWNLDQKRTGW